MNVLLLSSRFPWPAFTGDRLRASIWLSALEHQANVVLVSPNGRVPANAPRFHFYPAASAPWRAVTGVAQLLAGAPVHALLAALYNWNDAIERAQKDLGEIDATVVLLSRLDPWVRGSLPKGFRILDAIDSLRRSMEERAKESSSLTAAFWRAESRSVARLEKDAAAFYDRVVVVSEEDRAELGAVVISNGVAISSLTDTQRTFDFAFWGRLAYFANADAASWLIREIWPAVRAKLPNATLLIAGADAPASLRAAHGRDGIVVQSPFDDVAALTRSVKVALFPVRFGTGQSNKVLEAAEGGATIVATPHAMRGLDALTPHAFLAEETADFARAAVGALSDVSMASAARAVVEKNYSRQQTLDRLAATIHQGDVAA
jgi:glycosyltransferase involved in cell wall biosynthesis